MNEENERILWVGNLSDDVSEELLYELFFQAGPLERVTLPRDKSGSGKKRGFAFICFHHDVSVPYAYNLMNGMNLCGCPLRLQYRPGSSHDVLSKSQPLTPQTPNSFTERPQFPNTNNQSFPNNLSENHFQQQQLMMVQNHLGRMGGNLNFKNRKDMFTPSPTLFDNRRNNYSRNGRSEFNTPKLDRNGQYSSRSNSDNWPSHRNHRSKPQERSSSDNSDSQNYRDRESIRDRRRRRNNHNSHDRNDFMRSHSRHSNYGYGSADKGQFRKLKKPS